MGSEIAKIAVDASTPLSGEIDVEALIAAMPESDTLRGMFITPFTADLGDDFNELKPKLLDPPIDRYLALESYPTRDFMRVFDASARRVHPSCPAREAHRLRARAIISIFKQTPLGRSMLSVIHDPATLLLRYPESIGMLNMGFRGSASQLGPSAVKIELTKFFFSVEFMLGMFEGFVLDFGCTPHTEVQNTEPDQPIFLIEWR